MSGYMLSNWKCKKEYIILQGGEAFISSEICNGGCVIIPRHIHKKLGFWIEDHGKYGYEDKNYSDRAIAAGYIVGYIPSDILPVRHLGFEEGHIDNIRELAKKKNVEEKYFGEHLYVFNKFLFDKGIRKLYVDRRYLPEFSAGNVRFTLNPAYIPIIKMQQQYLDKIRYQRQDDTISVDLSRIP
jgi:hypothetical protein